jgi:hypothetical protein
MSQPLRDAIASVRRLAHHEMDAAPRRTNQVRYEPPPFDDGSSQEQGVFDAAPTNERSSSDDHGARAELPFEHPTAAEWFDGHGLHEEPPLTGDQGGLEQPFDQPAAGEEWPALAPDLPDSRASLDEDAPQAELRFDNRAERPLPTGDRTLRERSSFEAPAAQSPPFEGHAADEQYFERGWDEDSPPALPEASRVRAPRWSGGTQRRRWHLAALALAPIVVLVAGFGLGILSGAQEFDRLLTTLGWRSLADGSVAAALRDLAQPDPAPPSTTSAQSSISGAAPPSTSPAQSAGDGAEPPVEPAPSPQLSELQTVRVAPLPAPPKVEEAPDPVTSDLPLPPPPKPAPWSSLSGEERASGSDRIESAADVAAVPVLAADGAVDDGVEDAAVPGLATDGAVDDEVEDAAVPGLAVDDEVENAAVAVLESNGAGGPFEPILVKTSISEPRVFIHYTASAPGSPTTALHLVRRLRAAGFTVEGRAVEFKIPEDSIRYFFDGDRDEAEAVSAQLRGRVPGGTVPIVDFTSYEPKPRQGHLEVWLGG